MRMVKLVISLAIVGVIALFIWQNMNTWTGNTDYKLDLYLFKTGFRLELYSVIILSALAGFFVGSAAFLRPYLKTRRLLARERQDKKQVNAIPVKENQVETSKA